MPDRPRLRFAMAACAAAVSAAAPFACLADDAPLDREVVRRRVRELFGTADAGASANSGGSVRIEGNGLLEYADRSLLLEFLETLRQRVETALPDAFPPDSRVQLVVSAVTNGAPDDIAFVRRPAFFPPVRGESGVSAKAMIVVENPANALDAHRLAERATEALLGTAVAADAALSETNALPSRPPGWFAAGLAASFDDAGKQGRYDSTRDRWAGAQLPPVEHLVSADSPFPDADPALAAELVAWWLSFPDRSRRWETLRHALATGEEWTPDLFFRTGPGLDAFAADRDWDTWIVSRRRRVLSPGVTSRAHVARTLLALDLVPGKEGVPPDFADSPQPLLRLLDDGAGAWVRETAAAKIETLARLSVGRGDAFRAAAEKLSAALFAVSSGRRADAKLRASAGRALAELAASAAE